MEKETKVVKKSLPIISILTLIFVTLKLAEIGQVATWSWWWVLSPLWISWGILLFFILIVVILAALLD